MKKGTCFAIVFAGLVCPRFAGRHTEYQPKVEFVSDTDPERPVGAFLRGRIGIMQVWGEPYRPVTYRYSGRKSLTVAEQKSFLAKPSVYWMYALHPRRSDYWKRKQIDPGPPQQWMKARAKFARKKLPLASSPSDDWWEWTDGGRCLSGAFQTAIETLHDRARRFGPDSPNLLEWIKGQDQVFQNCSAYEADGPRAPVIPPPLPDSADPFLRADRAYQIAAAYFYVEDFEQAFSQFEAISRDAASPWRTFGQYLAARTVLQKAMLKSPEGQQFDSKTMLEAESRMRIVADQPATEALRASATGLLSFIELRLHPAEQMVWLSKQIAKPNSDNFGQEITDYEYLLQKQIGDAPDFPNMHSWGPQYDAAVQNWHGKRYDALRSTAGTTEITD